MLEERSVLDEGAFLAVSQAVWPRQLDLLNYRAVGQINEGRIIKHMKMLSV